MKTRPMPPSGRSVSGAYSIEVVPSSSSGPITIRPRLDPEQVRVPYPSVSADRLYSLPSKPTRQFDLLVLTPIVPARLGQLSEFLERLRRETLSSMQGSPPQHPLLDWASLRTVHYARFVIVDAYQRFGTGPCLAFSTSYDGPLGRPGAGRRDAELAHIRELVEVAGDALDTLYRACEGYSGLNNLAGYLAGHRQSAATFYVGSSGRPRDQVLGELALRARVHEVLDELYVAEPELDPEEVRRRVLADPIIQGIQVPPFPAQPSRIWRFALFVGVVVLALVAVIAGLFSGMLAWQLGSASLLATLGFAVLWLRYREQRDPEYQPVHSRAEREQIEEASTDEDVFLQNQLTHVVDVKPGMLRQALIRVVFLGLQQFASNIYNKGKLGSIPSIHFARWCLVDRGRRLIFFSNFDNSWESYLGDFIDQASSGLTAIWSNTVDYPSTRWLVQAGAEDAGRFKAWTRHYQVRTQVWYSAYPQLSIRNLNANTEIRRGLANPEQMPASVWLDWLQGIDRKEVDALHARERAKSTLGPKPTRVLEAQPTLALEDVQGLILHGYGPRTGARYLMLRVPEDKAAQAREWLSKLPLTDAVRGDKREAAPDPFINVAFTHAGLQALQLREQLLDEFPTAFVQGSAHPRRSVINGDLGESDRQYWRWGTGAAEPHVLLLVYATTPEVAHAHSERLLGEAERAGLTSVIQLEGGELTGRKEHFGFRDGIAQPTVHGCGWPEPAYNTVAPGEFLLGHPDEYGNIAHCPGGAGDGFGANGSYLVFRQLAQDVAAFWRYCDEQAVRLRLDPVMVAAKLVGRWPSGASLVKHPKADPESEKYQDEDAFAYLANGIHNDRAGLACPFGSHLRRTNPRDWDSGATRHEAVTIANRHRIIRRGRPYGMPASGVTPRDLLENARSDSGAQGERGLQFLAFSADLERQFEFVQQQWSKNPAFAGLSLGPDAVNGGAVAEWNTGDRCFTIQGDATSSSFGRCIGLSHFVKLLGSAYFFMPSVSAVRKLPGLASPR